MTDGTTDGKTTEKPKVQSRPSGMRTFVLIFLALHVPLFVYPVLRLATWMDLSTMVTAAILIPLVSSQVVSRWLLRNAKNFFARMLRTSADFWLGMSPILVITLLVFEVLVAIGQVNELTAAISVVLVTAAVSFIGLLLAVHPMVRSISFESARLKSPVRFVQITDVHIGSRSSRFLERVVARIKDIDPEFLCITGDFVDASGITEKQLGSLRELDCPIYFCIGNHERYEDLDEILKRLRNLGVRVLRTQSEHHRQDIQILGIDDRDDALQVERELAKVDIDREAFCILLYHRPRGLEAAERAGVDLMLSGHTHNGQIIPFNFVVNRVFERAVGLFYLGTSRLYVSQGTGTWGPIMRIGTRSEITLFELTSIGVPPQQVERKEDVIGQV